MAHTTRAFDVEIAQTASNRPIWPGDSDPDDGSEFQGNARYNDLRALNLDEAWRAIERDRDDLAKFTEQGILPDSNLVDFDEGGPDDVEQQLYRAVLSLDSGVSGVVAALAAIGCVPFSSCNGGAFGGAHAAPFPVVRFFAPGEVIDELMSCARQSAVGFEIDPGGWIEVYARRIEDMVAFAGEIFQQLATASVSKQR